MFAFMEEELEKLGIKYFKLTGQTKVGDRIKLVDEFNENEDIDYMFTLDELETEDEADEFGEFDGQDELLDKVAKHVVSTHRASVNQLQRVFNIGYNRADDMMNTLEKLGVVSPAIQGKPRTVLVEMDELERILNVYKG